MSERSQDRDDEFADLLVVYDEQLAAGNASADHPPSTIKDTPSDLVDRLERAKTCLELLAEVWPHPKQPELQLPKAIGRFRIVRQLGTGGFGVVFLAEDPQLNRQVALKVPHVVWLLAKTTRQHFLREAEAAARVNHPGIISVYEIGQDGPVTYIASEYCPGPSLTAWLHNRSKAIPIREAAQLVAKLATAMHHAHTRSVLHRDLKPGNILLSHKSGESTSLSAELSDVTPKIADFGLAKLVERSSDQTRTGAILGTLAYLAPEQAEGRARDISVQTDIYAMGAILYELLTGSTPNRGATDAETLQRILLVETASPRRLRAEVPADLAAVCLKCLEKNREQRYASAADLAEDLERFCDGRPTKASPIGLTRRAWRWTRRRPMLVALTAFSAAALLILTAATVLYNAKLRNAFDVVERESEVKRELLYSSNVRLAAETWQSGHVAQTIDTLAKLVPKPGQSDPREFTWNYLWNATHCEVFTLRGHTEDVYHVAISPDGRSLASAGKDGTARLWDLSSGTLIRSFDAHQDEVNAVVFTQDDKLASASDDGTVKIWDALTGQQVLNLEAKDGPVTALAISYDRRLLFSGGSSSQIHLWNIESGALLWTGPKSTPVESLSLSPDAKTLVSGHKDGTTRWWSVDDRQLLQVESSFKDWTASVAFSADFPEVAVAGRTGALRIYRRNASAWREKTSAELNTKAMGIYTVAFSPRNNMLATGTRDGLIEVWSPGAELTRFCDLPGHLGRIWCVAWSPDGRVLATASADGTIKVWNVPQSARPFKLYPRLSAPICSVAISPDNQSILTGTIDGRLHKWDRNTRKVCEVLNDHQTGFTGAGYLLDRPAVVATSPRGGLRCFNIESGAAEVLTDTDPILPCSMAVSGYDRLLAVGCEHGIACLFDAREGVLRHRLNARALDVNCVALTRDGKTLATAGVGAEIELWDALTGERKHVLPGHEGHVLSLAFSPDGETLISGGSDHAIRCWQQASGRLTATLTGQSGPIRALAISPDGRTLASGSDIPLSIRLWDLRTNAPLHSLHSVPNSVHALAFTSDGKDLIAGCGDTEGQLMEWTSVGSSKMPATDVVHTRSPLRPIEALQKPDGSRSETVSHDTTIESVDLFQAVNEYARRSGFVAGYPTFQIIEDGERTTIEAVLLRGVGIKKAFVMLDDFRDSGEVPRADYETQDALLIGLLSSGDRWSREVSYLGVVPTCFAGIDSNVAPAYEIGLLHGSHFSRTRLELEELDDLDDVRTTFRQVHVWATKAGYASAFPTFIVNRQQLECVAIRAGSAEVVEIPMSDLIVEPRR